MPTRNIRSRRNRRTRQRHYRHNKSQRLAMAHSLPFANLNEADFHDAIDIPMVLDSIKVPWPSVYLLPFSCFMEEEELNEEECRMPRSQESHTDSENICCVIEDPESGAETATFAGDETENVLPFSDVSDAEIQLLYRNERMHSPKSLPKVLQGKINFKELTKHLIIEDDKAKLCQLCQQPVFLAERIIANAVVFHVACFRCKNCRNRLCAGRWSLKDGDFFCFPCERKPRSAF